MLNQTVFFGSDSEKQIKEGFLIFVAENTTYPIEGLLTLGRNRENDVIVYDPYVSGQHCQIERRASGFFIRDLKSRNGTKLNGIRVTEAELPEGSEIILGNLHFTFTTKVPGKNSSSCPVQSKNKRWNEQLRQLPSVAESELPVFLQGESGTGKEIIAHLIHDLSERKKEPFVSVNCSALSESLAESELFGHVKGSFTGAGQDRKGAFESARGGTLFLDEIGDLPLTLQPKLLRALENKEIKPVGSDKTVETDVRIITATHKNLEALIEQKCFRSDLYFRIHVIKVALPPLRCRLEDFEDLFYTFCRENRVGFSVPAIAELRKCDWPGNIRELKNLVARAKAIYPSGQIGTDEVNALLQRPISKNSKPPKIPIGDGLPPIKEMERDLIQARLLANNYNQRRTATDLGIPKSTLHDRIKHYRISTKSR